jgi:CRP-like cAMP-binding protein
MVDRLIMIRSHLPFALRKLQALAAIALASEEIVWPEGSVICRADDPARGAIVIVDGQAVATRPGHDAIPLGPGNAVGRIETLAERGHSVTVEALSPVRALHGSGHVLFELLEDNPDLALSMIEALAGQLLDAADRPDSVTPWRVS